MVRNYLIESLWPLVTNAVDLGANLARWRKFWSVDADFSGVVTVTRTPVDGTDVPNKTYVDGLFVPLIATIEEVDGAPSYASPSVLRFDQADGFVLTQPAAGIVRVDLGTIPITSISGSFTDLGTTLTGQLAVADGGTNLTSYAIGDILYASAATTIASLVDVATGNAVISGGVGVAPTYGKIGLTTHISGVLDEANGGTGSDFSATAQGNILYFSGAGVLSVLAPSTAGFILNTNGVGANPSWAAASGGGQTVFHCKPISAAFPAANFPQLVKNAGTNWITYSLDYDQTTAESAYWEFGIPTAVPSFTGATCEIWYNTSVTSGTIQWDIVTISRADGEAWDTAGTTDTSAADTVPGTNTFLGYVSTALTVTGWAAGEVLYVKIARNIADSAAADVKLMCALIRLT